MPQSCSEFYHVVRGNIEALSQGIELLTHLSDEQYIYIASPYVASSIGAHFRHIIDMYVAVMGGDITGELTSDKIDYDVRRRGALVEERRDIALQELYAVKQWAESLLVIYPAASNLNDSDQVLYIDHNLSVKTEVTLSDSHSVVVNSSFIRELIFVSSHAVHHFALIHVIAKLQGVSLNQCFGIAPATATFLREKGKQLSDATVSAGEPTSSTVSSSNVRSMNH